MFPPITGGQDTHPISGVSRPVGCEVYGGLDGVVGDAGHVETPWVRSNTVTLALNSASRIGPRNSPMIPRR